MTFGNTVKKYPFKKIFPQLCKTSFIIILIVLHKWEKRVTELSSFWFLPTESLDMTCARSYAWFLNSWIFLSNGEGWDCFWQAKVLSRLSKITYLPKVSQFFFKKKLEALNLNNRVSLIQRVLLGTLPQRELTSLPHIHVTLTNLFISSLRGYCYQIWAVKTTPW